MSTFTICKKFLVACSSDNQLALNTIFHFVHDGPLRLAVDDKNLIINDYYSIAQGDSSIVASWLSLLGYRGKSAFDTVSIRDVMADEKLYFEVCSNCMPAGKLICDSKQNYINFPVDDKNVTLIDRAEASSGIRRHSDQTNGGISLTQMVTTGEKSPIIQGDENETTI